jgi:hypothetical protein
MKGESMKFVFLVLVACGRSECQDYTTVSCGKYALCVSAVDTAACEKEALKQVQASRLTEDQCKTARERVSAMSCAEYRALISQVTQ